MNLYDKRDSKNIIKSRVIKTRSYFDCNDCKIPSEELQCPKTCPRITTELHLDDGYIVYLSTKEIEFISKSFRESLINLSEKSILPQKYDEPPLDELEESLN